MRVLVTALGILAALAVQTILGQLLPARSNFFDPFLLVVVYCALMGGELHGMLAGLAAGWVQDVHFGGPVFGLTGLSRLIVGYAIGLASSRFVLGGAGARIWVLLGATFVDAFIFEGLARAFDVAVYSPSLRGLSSRAAVNALIGVVVFKLLDRRFKREPLL